MITLICDKCYQVYGCRATYHHPDDIGKLCIDCPITKHCNHFRKFIWGINPKSDYTIEGFCIYCLLAGGGL